MAVSLLGLFLLATPGRAEMAIPAQAVADNGAFLPYAPPPAQPGGLCLVDTGVNINPDTETAVVDRVAIDGGSGDDVSATTHGTVLAMMAAAPTNGWGMVGTAPHAVQIVSVRILEPGQTAFPFSSYAAGITECLQLRQQYDIRVINLSLGDAEVLSAEGYEALTNAIEKASDRDVAVVAAAGNDDGGPVEYPAAYPSVVSVGATDALGGGFCSFSNRGSGLRLLAPGCDLDGGDPASGTPDYDYWQGTSESSAIAAAALDALESYRPDLSPAAAEELLTGANGGVLDIAQTFRNAGLATVVSAGEATESGDGPTTAGTAEMSPQSVAPSSSMLKSFPPPHARLKQIKRRMVLFLERGPLGAREEVRYLGHQHHSRRLAILRTVRGTFSQLTLPASGVAKVSLRNFDPYDASRASSWVTLTLPRPKRSKTRGGEQ